MSRSYQTRNEPAAHISGRAADQNPHAVPEFSCQILKFSSAARETHRA